ncbi:primary-amine oxidase [Specibacter sp. RAF43]|uniref:primary-amine oxidase n=1 Tax=Specibacter sp. RAF43 TaxID=3233057 RepID=UPI003F9CF34D
MTAIEDSTTLVDTVKRDILASLTGGEINQIRKILSEAGLVRPDTRFGYVGLKEPEKVKVLAAEAGTGPLPARLARVLLLNTGDGVATDAVVSLDEQAVISRETIDGTAGQLPILEEEYEIVGPILLQNDEWLAALDARGVDPAKTVYVSLSAGVFGHEDEVGKRIIRVVSFVQNHPEDHPWAHPIDGLCAYVDTIERTVHRIVDDRTFSIPEEPGNFQDPQQQGPPLTGLKPIRITQPDGPSFTVDGSRVEWANWKFGISYDAREGLIIRQLSYADEGVDRPVMYRGSIAEMVVPYGDPSATRYWQNYFDTGEYLFGRSVNSLELGCDCVGEITYFDAVLSDELGVPKVIKNAVCMHEEDYGTLWKHTDGYTGVSEVRRNRRLVISFFTTIGNYDYGFYWYLYLDGTIECEAKLTGVVFTSAYQGEGYPFASEIAPGLGAPYHQHLFSARLDMTIDGTDNTVLEVDAQRVPMGAGNPWGNGFTSKSTVISTESDGARDANAAVGRSWHIVNRGKKNRLGRPVGYVLYPEQNPTLLADPASSIASRAAFTTKQLWVTQYAADEQYPAGDLVNQNPGGDGLPKYMAANRSLEDQDVVLWHTFGPTHFPRLEDWPVMPVDYSKFTLKPYGFFDRNPTLNVPASASEHCGAGEDSCHCG